MEIKIEEDENKLKYNKIIIENKKLNKENIILKQTLIRLRKYIEAL